MIEIIFYGTSDVHHRTITTWRMPMSLRPFARRAAFCACLLAPATAAPAQHAHESGASEPGQGAFAAMAEITALLGADPGTDWSRVDLDALRAHLVDMSQLMLSSAVTQEDVVDGAAFAVDLTDPGNDAASRMVPLHAGVLGAETGWRSVVTRTGDTLIWTVTDPQAQQKIRGLGFYGLMATGNHHPAHHMALARGHAMH
jgi:hypothetical protein